MGAGQSTAEAARAAEAKLFAFGTRHWSRAPVTAEVEVAKAKAEDVPIGPGGSRGHIHAVWVPQKHHPKIFFDLNTEIVFFEIVCLNVRD